jgi:hypothetical protein
MEQEMRRIWPDGAAAMHLSVPGMTRHQEVMAQRQFLEKKREPEMKGHRD